MNPDDDTPGTAPNQPRIRAFERAAELLTAPHALIQLSLDEARVVVGYMTPRFIPANTTFIQEGDVVVESITVSRTEPLTIGVLGPGSLIGEVGLVDAEPRSGCMPSWPRRCSWRLTGRCCSGHRFREICL